MKKLLSILGIILCSTSFSMTMEYADSTDVDSLFHAFQFEELNESLIYKSENPDLKIKFDKLDPDFRVILDGDTTNFNTSKPLKITDLNRGDHTISMYKKVKGEFVEMASSFKVKLRPPWVSNDAVVFGLLMIVLFVIFRTTKMNAFKGFYKYVPALLLCYFIPAALNSLGIVSSEVSNLYFIASRYLLPASLVLLCLSIDLKGILRTRAKSHHHVFHCHHWNRYRRTFGLMVGVPYCA